MTGFFAPAQAIKRLTPFSQALLVLDSVRPVAERKIPVAGSVGYVLAADVEAPAALPKRAQSLHDGFALSAETTLDASTFAPVLLTEPLSVLNGTTMPGGTDAVVALNAVQFRGGFAEIVTPLAQGDGVLAAGGECVAGMVLRSAGYQVRASDAAVFLLAGLERVRVRAPRVLVGYARESENLRIAADILAKELEAQNIKANIMLLADALRDGSMDAVLGVGGTGGGANDVSLLELAKTGHVAFHGVGLTPGETTGFGFIQERPVLLLPGSLDALLAVWCVLGKRFLARLSGSNEIAMATTAVLTRKVPSTVGMAEFVPVRVNAGKAEPLAAGHLPLSALSDANAWMLIPPGCEGYQADTLVEVQPWR